MPIPLTKESGTECFGMLEKCVFCSKPSVYWHLDTNNCVCQDCAKKHSVNELTNWLRK